MARDKRALTTGMIILGLVSVHSYCRFGASETNGQVAVLQSKLGTNEDTLNYMVKQVRKGMTKDDVERIVVGFEKITHHADGRYDESCWEDGLPMDCYSYYFGAPGTKFLGHLRVCVAYNSDQTVAYAFKDYR